MNILTIFWLPFLSSFVIGMVLVSPFKKLSQRLKIFTQPRIFDGKKLPSLGGLIIYITFLTIVSSTAIYTKNITPELAGILIGSSIIVALGVWDDFRELSPGVKVMGEILGVFILLIFGVGTKIVAIPSFLNILITSVWVIAITNAFNLLDILDGLASGIGFIASLTFLLLAFFSGNTLAVILAATLAGSLFAFLRYNFYPAQIAMGDTGSLFIGFTLSAIAISVSYAPRYNLIALLTPLLVLGLPIYDLLFLVLLRVKGSRSLFRKSHDHPTFRLLKLGYSERKVVITFYLLSFLLSLCAITVYSAGTYLLGILAVVLVVIPFLSLTKRLCLVPV